MSTGSSNGKKGTSPPDPRRGIGRKLRWRRSLRPRWRKVGQGSASAFRASGPYQSSISILPVRTTTSSLFRPSWTSSIREDELNAEKGDIEEREVNARAGYVYIISNIGSFGENVYKIGMTRCLDPQERVMNWGKRLGAILPSTFMPLFFFSPPTPLPLKLLFTITFDRQREPHQQPSQRRFFTVTLIASKSKQKFYKKQRYCRIPPYCGDEQYRRSIELRKQQDA